MSFSFIRRRSPAAVPPQQVIAPAASTPNPLGGLVARRAYYARNGVIWSSVRAWRSDVKRQDVAALRAAKAAVDDATIASAAVEIAAFLRSLFGNLRGWTVSTVAVGHSRRPDSFAVRLAARVAIELDLEFAKIFADRFVSGVSHPKEFDKLPPLTCILTPTAPVLLIDDVATSGWHLEEAVNDIRGRGVACVAIAWISGNVKG